MTSFKTPKCSNPFLEEDGYCTVCAEHHFRETSEGGEIYVPKSKNSRASSPSHRPATPAVLDHPDYISQNIVETELLVDNVRRSLDFVKADPGLDNDLQVVRAAWETVEDLTSEFPIPVKVRLGLTTKATHYSRKSGRHVITFGSRRILWSVANGMKEYQSTQEAQRVIRGLLGKEVINGSDAIKMIAAHEFAHVLEADRHGGTSHDPRFLEFYIRCLTHVFGPDVERIHLKGM